MRKNNEPTRVGIKSCYLPYQSSASVGRVRPCNNTLERAALRAFRKFKGSTVQKIQGSLMVASRFTP